MFPTPLVALLFQKISFYSTRMPDFTVVQHSQEKWGGTIWDMAHHHSFRDFALNALVSSLNLIVSLHLLYTLACEVSSENFQLKAELGALKNKISHLSSIINELVATRKIGDID